MAAQAPPSYDPFHDCLKGRRGEEEEDDDDDEELGFIWPQWPSSWSCGQDNKSIAEEEDEEEQVNEVNTVLAAVARYADEFDEDSFEDPRWWRLMQLNQNFKGNTKRESSYDVSMQSIGKIDDQANSQAPAVVATPVLFDQHGYDGIAELYLDNAFEKKLRQGLVAGTTADTTAIPALTTARRLGRFASTAPRPAPRRPSLGDVTNDKECELSRAVIIRKEISELGKLYAKGELTPTEFQEMKNKLFVLYSPSNDGNTKTDNKNVK